MKNQILLGVLGSLVFAYNAQAKIPVMDPAIGYALDGIIALASQSQIPGTESIQPVRDPKTLRRAQKIVQRVHVYGGRDHRYSDSKIILIRGMQGEPNAFSTGHSIYLSKALTEKLNDRELTAVLAHEMAHAERGHLTQRMSHSFAALLIHLGNMAKNNSDFLLHRDDSDSFIRELSRKGHWQMIQEMMESAELGQEMQADCDAYNILQTMRLNGLDNRPEDLPSAVMTLLDVPIDALQADDFMGARVKALLSGAYSNGYCD